MDNSQYLIVIFTVHYRKTNFSHFAVKNHSCNFRVSRPTFTIKISIMWNLQTCCKCLQQELRNCRNIYKNMRSENQNGYGYKLYKTFYIYYEFHTFLEVLLS